MTSKEQKIKILIQDIYNECQVDFDGFWRIVTNIKREGIAKEPSEVRKISLDIARALLEKGIIAGTFDQKKPVIYDNMSNEAIVSMIDSEWTKLGRDPNIGDIVCFASPTLAARIMSVSE